MPSPAYVYSGDKEQPPPRAGRGVSSLRSRFPRHHGSLRSKTRSRDPVLKPVVLIEMDMRTDRNVVGRERR